VLVIVALAAALTSCSSPGYLPNGDDGSNSDGDSPDSDSSGTDATDTDTAPVEPAPAARGDAVDPSAIVGVWSASDGSGTKIVDQTGRCSGMYWNNGTPLDIGGPMHCTLGSQQASDGSYRLIVQQPPNQATYAVLFHGDSFSLVSGGVFITLTRQ